MELAYSSLEAVEYEVGAQFYGVMEGTLVGDRLSGTLHLTNLAQGRPDGVNTPTLRGLLRTRDGVDVWMELDGLATLRPEDEARVFVTTCRFRTGEAAHGWLNRTVGLVEGVLDTETLSARARLYECRPTFT
jgi:hypothetical protein